MTRVSHVLRWSLCPIVVVGQFTIVESTHDVAYGALTVIVGQVVCPAGGGPQKLHTGVHRQLSKEHNP